MANYNSPFGFRVIRHKSGSAAVANEYTVATDYTTAIYRGDVVEMTGTGKNVSKAAAGNADNVGIFWGCHYKKANGEMVYSKHWDGSTGNTEIFAEVYDDPDLIFVAQCDTLAEGDVGALADIAVGTGSASTGLSGGYVDVGSGTATTGKSIRIRGLFDEPGNGYGAYAKAEVELYEHALNATAGAGV